MEKKIQGLLIIIIIIVIYALTLIGFLLTLSENIFWSLLRLFALFGFVSMAIASTMTPFAVELYKIYGKSFIKLHHIFASLGIIFATLHPVIFAIYTFNPLAFIPVVTDWVLFWELAGRPALIIIYIAALAALLRNKFKTSWKKVHALVYIALFFALIHGTLIGTSFTNILILVLFYGLFALVILAFVIKRFKIYKRKKKRSTQK
ncbi:MAG: hypothetical protein GF383_09830 [Candidatus Lokiarchaeota archaeon]|nr:hypothetical protein [Candidatus Lokiarchaeota archaeon]MBD3340823.1 hypothetical protein [Candidatus Lokiarchaeota archaeon]